MFTFIKKVISFFIYNISTLSYTSFKQTTCFKHRNFNKLKII